jgi:hypothetical protein
MLSMPKPSSTSERTVIHIWDTMLEHSWALEPLLDVVYTMDMRFLDHELRAHLVLDLAEKWDFAQARALIHAALSRRVHSPEPPSFRRDFGLSLKSKDPKLASACIKGYKDKRWGPSTTSAEKDGDLPFSKRTIRPKYDDPAPGLEGSGAISGGKIVDLGAWGYNRFLQVPPSAVWALLRATHVGTTKPAEIDPDKVAEEFERLLTLACKSQSYGLADSQTSPRRMSRQKRRSEGPQIKG